MKELRAAVKSLAILLIAVVAGCGGESIDNSGPSAVSSSSTSSSSGGSTSSTSSSSTSSSSGSQGGSSGSSSSSGVSSSSSGSSSGGSSSSSSSGGGSPPQTGGIWNLGQPNPTVPYSADPISMITTESGELFAAYTVPLANGASGFAPIIVGTISIASDDTVSGTTYQTQCGPSPLACSGTSTGETAGPTAFSGMIVPLSTFTFNGQIGVSQPGSLSWTYNSLYNQPSSLSLLVGSWSGGFGTLVVNADGSFSGVPGDSVLPGSDSGCTIDGQFSIINANYNAYDVRYTFSAGCPGNLAGSTATGIAAIDNSVNPFTMTIGFTFYNANVNAYSVGVGQMTSMVATQ
jgi:hypothetical protein